MHVRRLGSRSTGLIDVAVIQSLAREGVVDDCVADYGQLIVDECHHLSARRQVARQARALAPNVRHVIVLRAGMGRKQREAARDHLAAVPREEARVVIATGKYVGEGFDDPRLDTLFRALPVSWRGTIAQYAGRLHRQYDGKREVQVYDYADLNVPMLARMFDRRCRGYEASTSDCRCARGNRAGWGATPW